MVKIAIKYYFTFCVLFIILPNTLNCMNMPFVPSQIKIRFDNTHHKRIVDIRNSYENPQKDYLLEYEKIDSTYQISLYSGTFSEKKVLDKIYCDTELFEPSLKKELVDVIPDYFYTNFLWDTTSFYIIRPSDSVIVSICHSEQDEKKSDSFNSFYTFKIYSLSKNEEIVLGIQTPALIVNSLGTHSRINNFIESFYDISSFNCGFYSLLLGRLYDAYFFFKKSYLSPNLNNIKRISRSKYKYPYSDVDYDYFVKKSSLNNANALADLIQKDKIKENIEPSILNNTGKKYSEMKYFYPSVDSLYTIKKISYNKKYKYYTIIAKSNYGRKYRIISDTQDSLKYDDYPMILEEGKQYKIALQSFYLLTCYGGGNGGLEITHILNLGRRNIKLRYDSNYFFAFNLNGIYYKPIP